MFQACLGKGVLDDIRSALQTGPPLGNDYFRQKIEDKLRCKAGQARMAQKAEGGYRMIAIMLTGLRPEWR